MINESKSLLLGVIDSATKDQQHVALQSFSDVRDTIGFGDEQIMVSDPVQKVESIFDGYASHMSPEDKLSARKAFVAQLGVHLIGIIDTLDLPKSVLDLYPQTFEYITQYIAGDDSNEYSPSDDFYCKDLAFVLGMSLPCGAQTIDIATKLKPYSIVLSMLRSGKIYPSYLYLKAKGYNNWFGIHTDTRSLGDFNEAGWDACYVRIAEMLERRPHIRGMVGTSWFYDPQLLEISPRLEYLQRRPLERGAFMLKHGTNKLHVERATLTSKTRARLYNEGKYIPTGYSIVWPREHLIAWAKDEM